MQLVKNTLSSTALMCGKHDALMHFEAYLSAENC